MKRNLALLALLAIAAVFVVAGVMKALNPAAFAEDIRNYRLVPWTANVVLALYLPWLEIFTGAGLLWKMTRKGALLLALAMLIAFLIALVSAWARGLNISCGCFGSGAKSANLAWDAARDLALLAAVAWLIFREAKVEKSDCEFPKSG